MQHESVNNFLCNGSIDPYKIFGNKAKVRISKRVFQENKVRQMFRKTNISYPLIGRRTCAYQGVRNVCFSENLVCERGIRGAREFTSRLIRLKKI